MTRQLRLEAWDRLENPQLTPSLLACDFGAMQDEFSALSRAGVQAVHLDVMDGQFVPNLTYGPPVIARWRTKTDLPFDAHLMIRDPGASLDAYIEAGCDLITIHIEAVPEPTALLERIRAAGLRACLALNPPTPVTEVEPWLDRVDGILVMSVNPGFGGQSFQEAVLTKVRRIRELRPNLPLNIDGGINPQTAGAAVQAGATQLVAGSAIFREDGNYALAMAAIRASYAS